MDDLKSNLESTNLTQLENLGYALLPKSHKESPGYSGLLVAIRQVPTNSHYDPESIDVWIRDRNNLASQVNFTLHSSCIESVHVCPGIVILTDRRNKRVDFFTFGGHLKTVTEPDKRIYHLHSPAPILGIFNDLDSFSDQLAFEIEGLLAQLHALWARNDEGYARKMAKVDPTQFYLASLQEIIERYEHNRDLRGSWPDFYSKLLAEKDWLVSQAQWADIVPDPADLLAPTPSELQPNLKSGGAL